MVSPRSANGTPVAVEMGGASGASKSTRDADQQRVAGVAGEAGADRRG